MKTCALLLLAAATLSTGPVQAGETDAGRDVFTRRCVGCHQLPEPDALTPAQWATVLQTMQKRMRQFGMTELNEAEFAAVLAYLSAPAAHAP